MVSFLFPLKPSIFGQYVDFAVPPDCDVVILCKRGAGGLRPIKLLLPHQIYEADIRDLLVKQESGLGDDVYVVPVRSSEYIKIATTVRQTDGGA